MCINNNYPSTNVKFGNLPLDYLERARLANGKLVEAACAKLYPKTLKIFNKIHEKCKGEIGTNVINAIGTGLVAPIFIAYNPMSKTDEETKKYAALRQPVSAILAVGMQLAAIYPYEQFVKKMSNEGRLPGYANQTIVNDKKYIMKVLASQNKSWDKKKLSSEAYEVQLHQYAKAMKTLEKTGRFEINGHRLNHEMLLNLIKSTAQEMLAHFDKEANIIEREREVRYMNTMRFYRDNSQNVAQFFQEVETILNSSNDEKQVTASLKALKKKYVSISADFKTIADEIINEIKLDAKKTIFDKIKDRYKDAQNLDDIEIEQYVKSQLIKLKESLQRASEALSKIVKTSVSATAKDDPQQIKNLLDSAKVLGESEGLNRDFVYAVIEKEVQKLERGFKGLKDTSGLLVGLAMLPITCSLLNWLYPRLVEFFVPSLSKCSSKTSTNKNSSVNPQANCSTTNNKFKMVIA